MNPRKKILLQLLSLVGLALSILPAFGVFAGALSKEAYFQWLVAGMFLWFGTAIFWIKGDHLSE